MLINIWRLFIMHEKRCAISWWEDNKEIILNWGALYHTFGTSGIDYDLVQNFRILLDEKKKSNLKETKHCNLLISCWLLLYFFPIGRELFLKAGYFSKLIFQQQIIETLLQTF